MSAAEPSDPSPHAAGPADPGAGGPPPTRLDPQGRYIVVLREEADPESVRDRHARRNGLKPEHVYSRAVRGFAGSMTPGQVASLKADPDVAAVVPDEVITVAAQTIPTGVSRSGGTRSSMARIDGVDQRIDADVAVIDTGIDGAHPDLNVVGGYNCSSSDRTAWRDRQGHGTHVAGTVGAIDNGGGVVGVAPGVRLWAVKILGDDGAGYLSWYVCGLDWVAARRDPNDAARPLIEAVNMSVAKWGKDDGNCGKSNADVLHQAICRVTAAGITVVAAAANDSGNAASRVPAAYNEVITVSALADTDGKAGGLGGSRCYSWGGYDVDDTFADFSNYGADVDLIAPGKCIWSTLPGNRYGYSSGTSMAAPAVAGAAALYRATRPWSTPATTKLALQQLANTGWKTWTDPDGTPERLLDVSRLGPAGDFSVSLGTQIVVDATGTTIALPITVNRSPTHFELVSISTATPTGFGATLDRSKLVGFTGTRATLTLSVPASTPAGLYPVTVTVTEGPRVRTASTKVVIERDLPAALPPTVAPALNLILGSGGSVPLRVTWPAATDPTSPIAGYELQQSVDGGTWRAAGVTDAATREIVRQVSIGRRHAFRVRARDAAGNWSAWASAPAVSVGAVDSPASTTARYSRNWWRVDTTYAYGGSFSRTEVSGSTVKVSVTGRTLAVVAPVGPTRGRFRVLVDGVLQGEIDTYAATSSNRRVLWSKTFPTAATRIVELQSIVTSSRPRVDFDAVVSLQ